MILPVLVVVGAGMASLKAVRWAASVAFSVKVVDDQVHKMKTDRERSLGFNTEKGDEVFITVELLDDGLPANLKHLAGEHMMTPAEHEALVLAINFVNEGNTSEFDFDWFKKTSERRKEDWLLTHQVN
jgi:hypothetical protein